MTEEWLLDRSSDTPLYQQIHDRIVGKIRSGAWPVGTKIPTQRELAERFGVNRSTIVYALDELSADGLIQSKVGQGTVVANNTWNVIASARTPDWGRYVAAGAHRPNQQLIQLINKAEENPAILRLGTGEPAPELLPARAMMLSLQNSAASLSLSYSEPRGSLRLRETLSRYLLAKGINAAPSSILIVSGGLQALQLIALGLLHDGSAILTESPSYLNSVHVVQSAGIRPCGVPMDKDGLLARRLGSMKRKTDAAMLYTIPAFHNPTGCLMPAARREELLHVCMHERLPVVEDDVYGDLWLDEEPPPPLKAMDREGLVLYIGSMSKSLGPGLRLGWIVAPVPVIDRLADIKMQTDYGTSALSQHAVAEWLETGRYDEHLSGLRAELRRRRGYMDTLLNRYMGSRAEWSLPQGGFYIWLRIRSPIQVRRLFDLALKEGILLHPGSVYDPGLDEPYLRLSYAYASFDQMELGIRRLAALISQLSGDNTQEL
ncbi:PLP-dependent aminotransferase family protein [Paenibacillus pinisoli]|uniref:PLP-dependent aminotransferase family protein n=1 Tax=Paenibacillus pinisoli TaxID=1276110 RepID=A0A3A6PXH1_9BACL|nr:PLP-dependent aminotransferase family protein [Paenibacillus pinisoli]RJX38534.1 PLP-dependent aminotransferase family protein [Paenibacillus pinisoli]